MACSESRLRPRSSLAGDAGIREVQPGSAPPAANAPAPVPGVPGDVVQDEMRVEGRVILAGVVRVMGLFVQDEIRKQVVGIIAGVARHARGVVQDEMAGFR